MELAEMSTELHRYARRQAHLISGAKRNVTFPPGGMAARECARHPSADVIRVCFAFSIDTKRAQAIHGAPRRITINWRAPGKENAAVATRVCHRPSRTPAVSRGGFNDLFISQRVANGAPRPVVRLKKSITSDRGDEAFRVAKRKKKKKSYGRFPT